MDEKFKEEQKDLIGNIRNDIVNAFKKYKPQPHIATYVLETIKLEIINEVFKKEFKPIHSFSNKIPTPMQGISKTKTTEDIEVKNE